jgi:hypothetical protein
MLVTVPMEEWGVANTSTVGPQTDPRSRPFRMSPLVLILVHSHCSPSSNTPQLPAFVAEVATSAWEAGAEALLTLGILVP